MSNKLLSMINKACSGGNGGTTLQNKAWSASVAAGANVTMDFLAT